MTDHPRISLDPAVLTGKPVIAGTRLPVDFIIGLMADGWSEVSYGFERRHREAPIPISSRGPRRTQEFS